jgi:hypothetical protein
MALCGAVLQFKQLYETIVSEWAMSMRSLALGIPSQSPSPRHKFSARLLLRTKGRGETVPTTIFKQGM